MIRTAALIAGLMLSAWLGALAFAQGYGDYDYGPPQTGLPGQLQTARTHAVNAALSETLRGVREHLAHTINCLEGPRGPNYDPSNDNPCQGQGNGVIPDLQASRQSGAARALELAREADRVAVEAVRLAEVPRAKAGAQRVADLLRDALAALQ